MRKENHPKPLKKPHAIGEGLLNWFQGKLVPHRIYVELKNRFDLGCIEQFNALTSLGLREHHKVLDVGCGPLRMGRILIPFLNAGGYHGIEPQDWLVKAGIKHELGKDLIRLKKPRFSNNGDFKLTVFKTKFDFILAHAVFVHASKSQILRCLKEARKSMTPSSVFIATMYLGKNDNKAADWMYPWTVRYRMKFMRAAAREAGLRVKTLPLPHHQKQTWIAFRIAEDDKRGG